MNAKKAKAQIRETLDALGLALVEHGHQWSPELRRAYERAYALGADDNRDSRT